MGFPIQPLNSANAAGVSRNSGKYFQAVVAGSERAALWTRPILRVGVGCLLLHGERDGPE